MAKVAYCIKLILAFNLGVLVACLLAGCSAQVDLYWPSKDVYQQRKLVHNRVQGQNNMAYFQAWQADQEASTK